MNEYLNLVARVLADGTKREDRTGVGTISLFGTQSRYDCANGIPLVTTKKVNFRAIVAELLWFLSGSTNINDLDSRIWNEWADEDGNLGPIYGHQWRSWGAENHQTKLSEKGLEHGGIDQITQVIEGIRKNPFGRRHIVSAWNVEDIGDMALPPCHILFQFYVREGTDGDNRKYLDCQLYQRSADLALGVPFNIASYGLLLTLIARECQLCAGEFIHTIGDAHVYLNHVDGLKKQLERETYIPPKVYVNSFKNIFELEIDDIELDNYFYHKAISFPVAV